MRAALGLMAIVATVLLAACGASNSDIILATTTSTQDSGLLSVLVPAYEQASGGKVKVIAVGSGAALEMGQRGDADVLLVHSPDAEEKYMAGGFGAERLRIMYNDFVIIGPARDPAGVKGAGDAISALWAIAKSEIKFVSRGDASGTDALEKKMWTESGVGVPKGKRWYLETGQGMGATLTIAADRGAYTLTDRASYLSRGVDFPLPILLEGDPRLFNVYHLIVVNPANNSRVNAEAARRFRDFMLSDDARKVIEEFGKAEYGRALFVPDYE